MSTDHTSFQEGATAQSLCFREHLQKSILRRIIGSVCQKSSDFSESSVDTSDGTFEKHSVHYSACEWKPSDGLACEPVDNA